MIFRRYHLRHLTAATALVAVVLSVPAALEQRIRREKACVAIISQSGGELQWQPIWPWFVPERYRNAVVGVKFRGFREDIPEIGVDPFDLKPSTRSASEWHSALRRALNTLHGFRHLSRLDLSQCEVRADDLNAIAPAVKLTELNLSYNRVGSDLRTLGRCPRIRILSLRATDITDEALPDIAALAMLERLVISSTSITDAGLAQLSSLRRLQELDVSETALSDQGLLALSGTTSLRSISARSTHVKGPGIAGLRSLPYLERMDLSNAASKRNLPTEMRESPDDEWDRTVSTWTGHVGLETLDLREIKCLHSLRALQVRNTEITSESLAAISTLPNLRELDLSGSNVIDDWLRHLARTSITSLSISGTKVTAVGISHVARIRRLSHLAIERLNISAQDLSPLADLPRLELLRLDQVHNSAGLPELLSRLASLRWLSATTSGLSTSDAESLLAVLPKLEWVDVEGSRTRGIVARQQ